MTWLVQWNGEVYNVDPTDFDGLELSQIKKATGLDYQELIFGLGKLDSDAFRAVFWVVDRRKNAELKFSEYHGPTMGVILPHLDGLNEALEAVGKAMGLSATNGGQPSPNSTDSSSETATTS